MVDRLEELHRMQQESHEKARQDAIRKFKGKQLEEVLKKLDELHQPLEESYKKYRKIKSRNDLSAKNVILIIFSLILIIFIAIICIRCFESVLFFNTKLNWVAIYILYPFGVSILLYFSLVRSPRNQWTVDIKTGERRVYPKYVRVLFSFIGGIILPIFIYAPASVWMNFMNSHPIKFDSTLIEIKHHRGRYSESSYLFDCKVLAYKKENEPPSEEKLVMPLDQLRMPLKNGDRIILLGREGFAGVIIDEIKKAN